MAASDLVMVDRFWRIPHNKTKEPTVERTDSSDTEFSSLAPNGPKSESRVVQKETQEPLKLTEAGDGRFAVRTSIATDYRRTALGS